ncbi:hypothetical protein GQ44DRAFT_776020 [Phaeosphaeriaceae sp. PMI808]|nr:hypothetical protein GQ44DRAFT_776020 [Phaeosphaeriaceae sp. PMI808]
MALQILLLTPNAVPVRLVNPAMVVETVAQEAIGRLARLFRRMRAPSNLCALNLPPEIILMIATHLDECALVSLALTCQSLYGLWERRSLPLQLAEKEKLLLLLEKDIPFLYYCHYCTKLHRWHGRWSRSIAPWYEERLPCKRNYDNHLDHVITCHIPYYWARLVMNRHFYGSKHGLPLHVLNERAIPSIDSDGVKNLVSQHARIFNNQLLVLSVISSTHLRGDSVLLRSHIDSYGHSVCEHLNLRQGDPDSVPMQLPELAKKGNAPGQFLACGPTFGSCTFCPTDYSINILWQGKRKGYKIEVLVYRGLGDCRTPFSWHWRTLSTQCWDEEPMPVYSPDHRPGSVRDQWNKASGIAEITDGAWWRAIRWRL